MDNYITGATIKRLREEKGITQTQLAEQIGVSGKTVSKWEKGLSVPDAELLLKIADEFEVSVSELLGAKIGDAQNQNYSIWPYIYYSTNATICQPN